MHRLNRGAFAGEVFRYDNGPYRGWFGYRWNAGEEAAGSCALIGKTAAYDKLYGDMINHFRNARRARDQHNRKSQLGVVSDDPHRSTG